MPRLEDLKREILNDTPEQLRERIRQIREDRKVRKERAPARKEKIRSTMRVRGALEAMSPEERAIFLSSIAED